VLTGAVGKGGGGCESAPTLCMTLNRNGKKECLVELFQSYFGVIKKPVGERKS